MLQVYHDGFATQIVEFPYKIKCAKKFDELIVVWSYNPIIPIKEKKT
jgi:hypothetical protein